MRTLVSFLTSLFFISHAENQVFGQNAVSRFDSNYQPATFSDAKRVEKIRKTFPVIDKIFKGYADANHLPGVAYGLVVDGKLV